MIRGKGASVAQSKRYVERWVAARASGPFPYRGRHHQHSDRPEVLEAIGLPHLTVDEELLDGVKPGSVVDARARRK